MAGRNRGGNSPAGPRGERTAGQGSAGCLLWLVVFTFIFLLFVLNWGKISETLQRTNFNEILKNQKQADKVQQAPVSPAPRVEDPLAPKAGTAGEQGARGGGGTDTQPVSPRTGAAIDVPPAGKTSPQAGSSAPQANSPAAAAERALAEGQPAKLRAMSLYFVRIDDDGVIVRQQVTRSLAPSDSPLSDALAALIRGPNEDELRKHLVSLIPSGTKLLSVRMQGTTAVVNLGEAFMYNHYGIEGYAGQLKQIVYTATAFPTVHDVQILIDGERHDYLGGEGVYIGKPLSRNSF